MKKVIDGKFHIEAIMHDELPCISIIKTSNNEPIPDDEPVILIRARDYLALPVLQHYRALCTADGCTQYHLDLVDERIAAFIKFTIVHPERMKQPGITKGA